MFEKKKSNNSKKNEKNDDNNNENDNNYENIDSLENKENIILIVPKKNFNFQLKYNKDKLENLISIEDYIIFINDLNRTLLKGFYFAYKHKDPAGYYFLTKVSFITTIILNIILLFLAANKKIKNIFTIILTLINAFVIAAILVYIYKTKITHLAYTQYIISKFINKKLIEINEKIKVKSIEFKYEPLKNKLILYKI